MATVDYWLGAWISAHSDDDIPPGGTKGFVAFGGLADYGNALAITAHPLQPADPSAPWRFLGVENVRKEADRNGRRVFFDVRNSSADYIYAVGIGFGWIKS